MADIFKAILRNGGKVTVPYELRVEKGLKPGCILTLELKSVTAPGGSNGQTA